MRNSSIRPWPIPFQVRCGSLLVKFFIGARIGWGFPRERFQGVAERCVVFSLKESFQLMSNEKNPGCLGYIGDYTTQLYRDYNKPSHDLTLKGT